MTFQPIGLPASRVMARIIELRRKEAERIDTAVSQARASGLKTIDVALTEVGVTLDEAAKASAFKQRILGYLRLGTGHPIIRARFGRRAAMLRGYKIDAAIFLVNRWYGEAKRENHVGAAMGYGNPFSVEVLRELRAILRLIRRSEMRDHFPAIVQFVVCCEPMDLEAAV
jgi:hypothetical protein